jgi:hypothetical protein
MNNLEQVILQSPAGPNSSPSAVEHAPQIDNSLAAVGIALNRLGILGYVRVMRTSQVPVPDHWQRTRHVRTT